MVVRFWEARVASGRLDDAVRWTNETLHARARERTGYVSGEVFVSDEVVATPADGAQPARVVLLTRWAGEPGDLDETPPGDASIDRAHGWWFRAVP